VITWRWKGFSEFIGGVVSLMMKKGLSIYRKKRLKKKKKHVGKI